MSNSLQEILIYAINFHVKDTTFQIYYYLVLINSFFLFGALQWTDLVVFRIFYYDFVPIIYIFGL